MKKLSGTIASALFLMHSANAQQPAEHSFQIKFKSEKAASQIIASRTDLNFIRVIPFASDTALEQRHRDAGMPLWKHSVLQRA